jgi:hypothetical protein
LERGTATSDIMSKRYYEEAQQGYDSEDGITPADLAEETDDENSFVL